MVIPIQMSKLYDIIAFSPLFEPNLNFFSQHLARGLLVKRNGNRLPSAANMLKMRYNCTLESLALTHARLCTNTQSSGRSNIGENIAQISRSVARNKLQAIEKAVSRWWKQSRGNVNIGQRVFYRAHHTPLAQFVQMAWSSTHQLGCGIAGCSGFYNIVCQYFPAMGTFNQNIYQPGTPCSACPSGFTCTDQVLCN
ncbi:SCP-like protein [Ancylostoma caninum]|uniref:SCP-like protein n=1 Tax=Ancylostoma caninum TaxID=29170 RepID=A0A368HA91_ANCCA|nr:SCP-like protein [Ancylostoma caninum]